MSGRIRGKIEMVLGGATDENCARLFKNIFDFFESHPNMTRIALQYGLNGTGTDHFFGTNPFGQQAFAVWRREPTIARSWPYYIFLQSSAGSDGSGGAAFSSFGSAPGDPGHISASGGNDEFIGFSAAVGIGGDENPWNGTTSNDGTDSKGGSAANPTGSDGNPAVWRIPAGGSEVAILPRDNNTGASDTVALTDKALCLPIADNPASPRYNIVADDDSIWWSFVMSTSTTTRLEWRCGGLCLYTPIGGFSDPRPLILLQEETFTDDLSDGRFVGIVNPHRGQDLPVLDYNLNNSDINVGVGDAVPSLVSGKQQGAAPRIRLATEGGRRGYVGVIDTMPCFAGSPSGTTGTDKRFVSYGGETFLGTKLSHPWDGVTTPGSLTRTSGFDFVRDV